MMSEPMPFAKIRLSLMFAAEHELPIELGTDEVWSVLNKLDQLSAETGKAIARAEAAERELRELRERTRFVAAQLQRENYLWVEDEAAGLGEYLEDALPEQPEAE